MLGGLRAQLHSLGGSFIHEVNGRLDIKQKVSFADKDGKKKAPECVFSQDGKKLLVSTADEYFALLTNIKNDNSYGNKKNLPHLTDGDYSIFQRKKESFLFLEHNEDEASLSINFYQPKLNEKFNDLSIPLSAFKHAV